MSSSKGLSIKNNMTPSSHYWLWLISIVVMLFTTASYAENPTKQHRNIQNKISSASSSLQNSRAVFQKLRKKVIVAEDKLNTISRQLRKTEIRIDQLTSRLIRSNKRKKKLTAQSDVQKKALAKQMQALYISGKQSYLRLLLKQDDPSDISRAVKYYEYMNKYRLKRIKAIKRQLEEIDRLQVQINKDSKTLSALQKQQRIHKQSLKIAVLEKERSLKKQNKIVLTEEQTLKKLKKEEAQLKKVLQRLADNQEKERAERLAKKRKKIAKDSTIASTTQAITIERHYVPDKPFSKLRGKLSWPVRGTMLHRYNSRRNSIQKWKAVVISTPGGTKVHAVARGIVEFSGRMNGYGYLIIIRHDKNYLSLYGYNRSIYKKKGEIVKKGEIIAAVGNSGGLKDTGLFFQIRKGTAYQNPEKWCK